MHTEIGTLIRRVRQSHQLSQGRLAQAAGIGRVTLNRWETGVQRPRLEELNAVMNALHADTKTRGQALGLLDTPESRAAQRAVLAGIEREVGIGALPNGGDLLRSLRLRRGLKQEDAAARIGVTARTLRNWETMASWPEMEQLQSLCYALGAFEEEIIALTVGLVSASPVSGTMTIDEVYDALDALKLYSGTPRGEELRNLQYLALEARAWTVAVQSLAGRQALAEVYAYHANYLSLSDRFAEMSVSAERALAICVEAKQVQQYQVRAEIVLARAQVFGGARPFPKRGIRLLQSWSALIPWHEYQAWVLADLAKYYLLAGDVDSGIRLGDYARQCASQAANPHEYSLRTLDLTHLLLMAKRPREALSLLETQEPYIQSSHRARFLREQTEARLILSDDAPASETLPG